MKPAIEWYRIINVEEIDSPALVLYTERIEKNIRLLVSCIDNVKRLRPHVKTNKMIEVCQLMLNEGIGKFKCATIAEADMLGMIMAPNVLLAYQLVGPKMQRFINLVKNYPKTRFSCLIDNPTSAEGLSERAAKLGLVIDVCLDLNIGQNRTGIKPERALQLWEKCLTLAGIEPVGLHAYDGHIYDTEMSLRKEHCDNAFKAVQLVADLIQTKHGGVPVIIAGGSATFPIHRQRTDIECSPGTFVFWDYNYKNKFPDEQYEYSALVLTRVISIVNSNTICTDLGYKSVASENPQPRIYFLNAPQTTPVSQNEEHLILKVENAEAFTIGEVLYGVPFHICPTVALYESAISVKNNIAVGEWDIPARNRKINF